MMEILVAVLRRVAIPAANGATVRLEEKLIAEVTKADAESNGAEERTRTFMGLPPLAPEASASANSATSAFVCWAGTPNYSIRVLRSVMLESERPDPQGAKSSFPSSTMSGRRLQLAIRLTRAA